MPPPTGSRALAADAAAVAIIGVGICTASDQGAFMSVLVAAVILLRFLAWALLSAAERGVSMRGEIVFFAVCLFLGAANDWNSVVHHRVYDYDVAVSAEGTIPAWMLAYWGIILRCVATLCRWRRIEPPTSPEPPAPRPLIRVSIELLLVLVTRQLLYRYSLDPVLSWLPFALALVAYGALFGIPAKERRLAALAAVVGPLVEIAFIHLGALHHYHLGWLGGVPLWIVLWWVLAVLIWNDLSARLLGALAGAAARPDSFHSVGPEPATVGSACVRPRTRSTPHRAAGAGYRR